MFEIGKRYHVNNGDCYDINGYDGDVFELTEDHLVFANVAITGKPDKYPFNPAIVYYSDIESRQVSISELTEEPILFTTLITQPAPALAPAPWVIGANYFIQTATMSYTGQLATVTEYELLIRKGAWIADSGRLSEFLKDTSKVDEAEVFDNDIIIGRGALISATIINDLITETK